MADIMKAGEAESNAKAHRARHSGPKAAKKTAKKASSGDAKQRNAKAFTFKSAVRAARAVRRNTDLQAKKMHLPSVDRTPTEPPPFVVAVVGPPRVGKSTLMASLVKNFARQNMPEIRGPVTIVSGKGNARWQDENLVLVR